MSRLIRPIICAVTPGRGDVAALQRHVSGCVRAGISVWHLRERTLADRDLLALACTAAEEAHGSPTAVVINDRADIAIAARAAGVHLRADSPRAGDVRAVVGDELLVGRSVHGLEEAREAERDGGCDYLVFGTVFPSASKGFAHPVAGLDALQDVVAAVHLPVVAIGGISLDTIAAVAAVGAAGIAAIALFQDTDSLADVVSSVRRRFDTRS